MTGLLVAEGLELPLDFVTKTAAILAQRRKGKTYTASVVAEELVRCSMPFAALDPTGAWWGLRSSADGKSDGLPVVILGGSHGDLPLDRTSGRAVADLVVDHPGYYVVDLSLLESKSAEREFAAEFAERLYRRKMQPGLDFPLHLFVDEADMFVPQDREAGDNRMLGAFQSIVRRGGLHGLGCTLIGQRPALINKSVLTQLDVLVLLRLVAGNDQDYVDKNYISRAGSKETRAELMGSMASLGLGEAWVWEPGAEPALFERVRVRERRTFNSSATPKAGETRVLPSRVADVDLAAIKEKMLEAVARAEADDPKALHRRIRDLEAELTRSERRLPERVEVEKVVPVEVVPAAFIRMVNELEALVATASDTAKRLVAGVYDTPPEKLDSARPRAIYEEEARRRAGFDPKPAPDSARTRVTAPAPVSGKPDTPARLPDTRPPSSARTRVTPPAADDLPGGAPLDILKVLAQRGEPLTARRAGWLAGYSSRKSTVRNAVSALRKRRLIVDVGGGLIEATAAGEEAVAHLLDDLPTGPELRDHWLNQLGDSAPGRILRVLLDRPDLLVDNRSIAVEAGIDPNTSTFRNAMSQLRRQGLVEGNHLDPDFRAAIGL